MCLYPFSKQIKTNPHSPVYSVSVPCGKCIECIQQYQNGWIARLFCESLHHSNLLFFTLTYNPETVPELVTYDGLIVRTVYKKHVQDWLKRFRSNMKKHYGEFKEFKYFITSEYGPLHLRPHYHGLIFGVSKKDFIKHAIADWSRNYGFCDVKNISLLQDVEERDKHLNNVIRYVSKYCMKGEHFENPFVLSGEVYPNFRLISKGIGKSFINGLKNTYEKIPRKYSQDTIAYLAENNFIKIGGCKYSLPRYFKQQLYGSKTLISLKIANYLRKKSDDFYLSQFAQVQTQKNWTDIQTFRYLALQEDCTKRIETEKKFTNLSKFYNKSKF